MDLPSNPCHCGALRKASRKVNQIYDAALSRAGLTNNQFSLLWEIARRSSQPLTMGDLAEVAVMDRSTLGHNLRPLVRDGLVKLVPANDDRRSRRIHLTAAGSERLSRAASLWEAAQARFESVFGVKPATDLRRILLKVAALEVRNPKNTAQMTTKRGIK